MYYTHDTTQKVKAMVYKIKTILVSWVLYYEMVGESFFLQIKIVILMGIAISLKFKFKNFYFFIYVSVMVQAYNMPNFPNLLNLSLVAFSSALA